MGFRFQVVGMKQAFNNLDRYFDKVSSAIESEIKKGTKNIAMDAKTFAPKDLGELRDAIAPSVVRKRYVVNGKVLSLASYSGWVEWGTSPHFPPIAALEGWASRHDIPAWAVQKSIGEKGTPAQPFMWPAYKKNESKIIRGCIRAVRSA